MILQEPRDKRPLNVLVVEDSAEDAAVLIHELDRAGYRPQWQRAATSEQLEAALAQGPWDIVVSDYDLCGFTGLDALAFTRCKDRDVPFIILSGVIAEDMAVDAMKQGANDYVVKGQTARLVPAIRRELSAAADRRERLQLQQRLGLFRQMLDESHDCLFLLDPTTAGLVDVNLEACRRLCLERGRLLEKKMTDIDVNLAETSSWDEHIGRMKSCPSLVYETRLRRSDRVLVPARITMTLHNAGAAAYVVAAGRVDGDGGDEAWTGTGGRGIEGSGS